MLFTVVQENLVLESPLPLKRLRNENSPEVGPSTTSIDVNFASFEIENPSNECQTKYEKANESQDSEAAIQHTNRDRKDTQEIYPVSTNAWNKTRLVRNSYDEIDQQPSHYQYPPRQTLGFQPNYTFSHEEDAYPKHKMDLFNFRARQNDDYNQGFSYSQDLMPLNLKIATETNPMHSYYDQGKNLPKATCSYSQPQSYLSSWTPRSQEGHSSLAKNDKEQLKNETSKKNTEEECKSLAQTNYAERNYTIPAYIEVILLHFYTENMGVL